MNKLILRENLPSVTCLLLYTVVFWTNESTLERHVNEMTMWMSGIDVPGPVQQQVWDERSV
jgi:hypothetical protein